MKLKVSPLRWLITLLGVQLLCAVVWILGPLLSVLEPLTPRICLVAAALIVWAIANLALDWRRSNREAALANGIASGADEEAAAIGARLATAIAHLKQANGRRGFLYEQPWYAIIGPPGAGKTTALLNAGLNFPLSNELGPGAVAGVGGTRLCDWWFTDDAVLIDTAGRYTTQDSDKDVDRAGWDAFLTLLRRTRPRQPLNGVIVAIALSDIASDQPAVLETHARAIRARIDELETRLGVRMPIYAVFTKTDLLAGFTEFFADLDRAGRDQIWGTTLPLDVTTDLTTALRPLLERLNQRMYVRLDAESDPERRTLIAGFPAQLASVLPRLEAFITRAFGPNTAGKSPFLRGAYLTSGTQEGTPIDRLIGTMARTFGLDQQRAARLRPEVGRSYFLGGLLRDVVFREAMLMVHRPGADRLRKRLRLAGFTLCGLAALAGVGLLWHAHATAQAAIDQEAKALSAVLPLAADVPTDAVAESDFPRVRPFLDSAAQDSQSETTDRIGFAQNGKLQAARAAQYRHALEFVLYPRLLWRVETRMRGALNDPDALYDATRLYLMLGGAGPMDSLLVQDWFTNDWAAIYAGEENAALRAALQAHLAALLREPLPRIGLDGPLVAQARAVIGRVPLAERAWSRLKPAIAGHLPPPWKPSTALGPAGVQLFGRLSGRGLEEGISGLFTAAGFQDTVLPALAKAVKDTTAEGWVIGETIAADSPARATLDADVVALYAAEYIAVWDAMLADINPSPPRSLTQAAQDLFILASPYSPIRTVLASAAKELAPASDMKPSPVADAIGVVDQRFRPVRGLFGSGGAAPIDQVLRPLGDLQQQLAKLAASTTRPSVQDVGQDPAAALRTESARQPQPLARWLASLATSGAALRDGGPRGALIAAWNAGGGPLAQCLTATTNRYPFAAGASADTPIADFSQVFGPGGGIDAYFNTQLKSYVDTTTRPWKFKVIDGFNPPVTAAALSQFQRAAAIRDLFFPPGGAKPLVRFDLVPGEIDPATDSAALELDSTRVAIGRDSPVRPAALSWPGPVMARLTISAAGSPFQVEESGPWALFRLAARARITGTGDRQSLQFGANGRTARFDLRANPNPFTTTLLAEFRCPAVQ